MLGFMNLDCRIKLLYAIISDHHTISINKKKYIVIKPTQYILHQAHLFYEDILYKNRYNDWIKEDEYVDYLMKIGKLPWDSETKIKELEKFIEDRKVELYQSYANLKQVKNIRRQLKQSKNLLYKLRETKLLFFSFTLKGFAEIVRQNYILCNTIYYNDKLLSDISQGLLNKIKIKTADHFISPTQFREIARGDPWRSYWGITDNPFSKSVIDLDYDKRTLIAYSKMYDNIYENPDRPDDSVISDDDALDGWMILQKRKQNQQKKEEKNDNIVNKLSDKYNNASEIFLPASSKEEVKNISKMNSAKGQQVKSQRQKMIDKQGKVGAGQLPDEMLERQLQRNRESLETIKNK